jgi:hypothetical protein
LLNFWRSGPADVYVDGVTMFSAPQPVQSPLTWTVPGGNYRGGGIWVRYTDGDSSFSVIEEADLTPERIAVQPTSLLFLAGLSSPPPAPGVLTVEQVGCDPFTWEVSDDAAWLSTQAVDETVVVSVDAVGLGVGRYQATIVVEAETGVLDSPARVPVTLVVGELYPNYLPCVRRL